MAPMSASIMPSLDGNCPDMFEFTGRLRKAIHTSMVSGQGTRDLCGPAGLTTEQFVQLIGDELAASASSKPAYKSVSPHSVEDGVDDEAMMALFKELDTDGNGAIDYDELKAGLIRLNVAPKKIMAGDGERWAA